MVTNIVKEWEVTVSITRTLKYSVEDFEDANEFKKWANSLDGNKFIQNDFVKGLKCYPFPKNADLIVDDVILKDYEVKSTDTDLRV